MVNWDKINLSSHIKKQYDMVFKLNLDTVTVIKRQRLDGSNFFSEDITENETRYTVKININPVKNKHTSRDSKAVAQSIKFECYTNPDYYPKTGLDVNGNIVNTPFSSFVTTDKISYDGHIYEIDDDFETIALNQKPTLWQHFFMNKIN